MNVGQDIRAWASILRIDPQLIRPAVRRMFFELDGSGTASEVEEFQVPDGFVFLVLEVHSDSYPLTPSGRAVPDARRPYPVQDRTRFQVIQGGVSTESVLSHSYLGPIARLMKGSVTFNVQVGDESGDFFEDTTLFNLYVTLFGLLFPVEHEGELARYVTRFL